MRLLSPFGGTFCGRDGGAARPGGGLALSQRAYGPGSSDGGFASSRLVYGAIHASWAARPSSVAAHGR